MEGKRSVCVSNKMTRENISSSDTDPRLSALELPRVWIYALDGWQGDTTFLPAQITCLSHIFSLIGQFFTPLEICVAFPHSLRSLLLFWLGFCLLLEFTGPR